MAILGTMQQYLGWGYCSMSSSTSSTSALSDARNVNEVGLIDVDYEFKRRQEYALHRKLESSLRRQQAIAFAVDLCPEGVYSFVSGLQRVKQAVDLESKIQKVGCALTGFLFLAKALNWEDAQPQQHTHALLELGAADDYIAAKERKAKELYGEIFSLIQKKHILQQQQQQQHHHAAATTPTQPQYVFTKHTARRVTAAPQRKLSTEAAPFAPKLSANATPFTPKASEVVASMVLTAAC